MRVLFRQWHTIKSKKALSCCGKRERKKERKRKDKKKVKRPELATWQLRGRLMGGDRWKPSIGDLEFKGRKKKKKKKEKKKKRKMGKR